MFRFLTALFIAFCVLVIFTSLSRAAETCVAKPEFIEKVMMDYPAAIPTDLNGEHEKMLLAGLSRMSGRDLFAYDLVMFRHPGKRSTMIVLFLDGCAVLQTEILNDRIGALMGSSA